MCAKKQVIRATVLSKQCMDTYRDSHDATRHKLRRTLAYNFQQSHLPFRLQFVTLDLFSRFTVRPDGRTPFQYLLGTPYVSPLCMFGESVFALIPDHEVRAAKPTNRWIIGCWWGRDASSDEHLVGTKHGLLKCRSVRRKPPGEQWSRRETIEARGTKWNFDVEMDSGIPGPTLEPRRNEGMPTATAPMEILFVLPPAPSPEEHVPEMRGQGVHAKALRIRAFWTEIGRTPGCLACETPGPGKSHTGECKTYQDAWEQHQRRRRDAELLEIRTLDRWIRVRVQRIRTQRNQKQPL